MKRVLKILLTGNNYSCQYYDDGQYFNQVNMGILKAAHLV